MRIIALSGSLRARSYNTALAHTLADLAPEGCDVEVVTPAGIPVYDGDAETEQGVPDSVRQLKEQVAAADGLILVTPEYNQGVPGPFKNAIDWMSRPSSDIARVFGDRPVALCGASTGGFGTKSAQNAWLPTLRALKVRLYAGHSLFVSGAGTRFDAAGALVDDDMRKSATAFINGFCAFVRGV